MTLGVAKTNTVPVEVGGTKRATKVWDDAKGAITDIARRHGMKEIAVVSRVYLWLARQSDDVLVKGVLGLLPEGYEGDIARLALERLAKGEQNGRGKGR